MSENVKMINKKMLIFAVVIIAVAILVFSLSRVRAVASSSVATVGVGEETAAADTNKSILETKFGAESIAEEEQVAQLAQSTPRVALEDNEEDIEKQEDKSDDTAQEAASEEEPAVAEEVTQTVSEAPAAAPTTPSAILGSNVSDSFTSGTGVASCFTAFTPMCVAVPIEYVDALGLRGHQIVVTYNGVSVTANIEDCGSFLRYGRSLDLGLDVAQALDPSVTSENSWGIRDVSWQVI